MTGSMYAAIAGLKTHMQNLNVIGNNIANVNTQGYKSARAVFKSSIYTTLSGGSNGTAVTGGRNPSQIGYGAQVANVGIDMSTGNYTVTGNPTDIMLDGEGFLMVGDKEIANNFTGTAEDINTLKSLDLTRVGDIEFKADGYLCNGDGRPVYGFLCIGIATEADVAAGKAEEAGKPIYSDQLVPIRVPRVYEANGKVEIGWPSQALQTAPGTGDDAANPPANPPAGGDAANGANVNNWLLDFGATIGPDGKIVDSKLEQSKLTGITIDRTTGIITATCSDRNNEIITIGCIALGMVSNPNGVTNLGNNYYKAGEGSGNLKVATMGGASTNMKIDHINKSMRDPDLDEETNPVPDGLRILAADTEAISSGLEMSKTDLAQEIANMIVTQRGYQANTRIVTVTDSMLEELVNMKR